MHQITSRPEHAWSLPSPLLPAVTTLSPLALPSPNKSLSVVDFPSCCSVAQSRLTLCDPMDSSSPGVPGHLPVCPSSCPLHRCHHPAIMSSDALFTVSSSALNLSQHQGLCQ